MKTYIWKIKLTDTFGGEANYCWVRHYKIEASESASRRTIITRAKKELGWTGMRCQVEDYGDNYAIRPADMCQIAFVNLEV